MIDIKRIKDNPEAVKAGYRAKEVDCDEAVDRILELDAARRAAIAETEAMKAEQNKVSKQIPQLKKAGEDVAPIFARMGELKTAIAANDEKLGTIEAEYRTLMLSLPNLPDPDLTPGGKENNEPLRYYGEPHKFDFEPKHHVDLCTDLGLIDYERGVKLAGSGFWLYKGMGARLEWALLNYFMDCHLADGYEMVMLPICWSTSAAKPPVSSPSLPMRSTRLRTPPMTGCTLCCPPPRPLWPPCTAMRFCRKPCCPGSSLPTRLASVAKPVPIVPMSAAWFVVISSTRSRCSSTPCRRSPTRLLRNWSPRPKTWSRAWASTSRTVKLAAGDCSASMARTYDIEIQIPSMNGYKEVSSVSNARDYQARRGNIRFRREATGKPEFVHTLNGSGLATSRIFPAMVEQNQRADGSHCRA